jgi:hypothetical protein
MSKGQIIWVPPLPAEKHEHVCRPPQDEGLILQLTGTVWRCECGKTWHVDMTADGHRWSREGPVRRWWRHARHGVHPTEAARSTTLRLAGARDHDRPA